MLAGALRLASLSLPSAPTITFSHRPVGGTAEAPAPENAPPGEHIVVVPGVPEERGNAPTSAGADRDATDSTLTQLSSALQESVRRQVWGEAWERVRDALARAATSREDALAGELEEDLETASTDDWEMASAPSGDLGRRRRPGVARHPSTRAEDPAPTDASADAAAEQEAEQEKKDAGAGRSGGAGNGTDPNVFGGPRVQRDDGAGSFELSLAARMRTDQGRGEASGGPPPVAAPDARPALAAQQRRESAAHRMTVPAAYEAVVREVFAHRKQP
jgi:hypothetical protein